MSVEESKPVYSWLQEDNTIIITFEIPAGTVKSDVEYELRPGSLSVGVKDLGVLLSGDLYGKVDVESSSWIITDNHVYVYTAASDLSYNGQIICVRDCVCVLCTSTFYLFTCVI